MRTKFTSLIITGVLLGTVLLAVAPTAEAQQTQPVLVVSLGVPSGDVKPLQGSITIPGEAKFSSESTASTSLTGVAISYKVKNAPSWASVTVSPTSDVITFPTGGTPGATVSATAKFIVTVSASDQAPAFQPAVIEIEAVTQGNQAFKTAQAAGASPIQADYFALLDVQLAETIKVDRPQTPVVFPMTITNLGNANTKVNFEILESTTSSLQVPIPGSQTLQSKQAGGQQNSVTVPLTVQTPYKNGYMNEVGVVNVKVTSHYALNAQKKGPDESVSVLVTTKGFYVPGPGILSLVALLGVAAIVLRRRE